MLIHNARVIVGNGTVVQEGVDIAIAGSRIAAVGPALPSEDEVWDVGGRTVIPGLVNAHVHVLLDAGPDPLASCAHEAPSYLALRAAERTEAMLRAGITTARDLGGVGHADLAVRRALQEGYIRGPRLLASGQWITMTGGHGWRLGIEADGPDAVRHAARTQIKAGVNVVKLMATGGVLTPGAEPGAPALTEDEMRVAVEEAHNAGRLAAAHAQGTSGIANAVRAGIDSIEHGIFLTESLSEEMARRQVFFVPTLAAPYFILQQGEAAGVPAEAVEKVRRIIDTHRESVYMARRMGVPIVAGNDGGTPFNRHEDLVTELRLLVDAGLSPMEALLAATREAARLLHLENEIGTIEPGKRADLVVLDGDPLADITAIGRVRDVVQAGRRVVGE